MDKRCEEDNAKKLIEQMREIMKEFGEVLAKALNDAMADCPDTEEKDPDQISYDKGLDFGRVNLHLISFEDLGIHRILRKSMYNRNYISEEQRDRLKDAAKAYHLALNDLYNVWEDVMSPDMDDPGFRMGYLEAGMIAYTTGIQDDMPAMAKALCDLRCDPEEGTGMSDEKAERIVELTAQAESTLSELYTLLFDSEEE